MITGLHMGRSWSGHPLEDECPCPQVSCGLVAEPVDGCPQHDFRAAKTMRQVHRASDCPQAAA